MKILLDLDGKTREFVFDETLSASVERLAEIEGVEVIDIISYLLIDGVQYVHDELDQMEPDSESIDPKSIN